MRLPGFFRIPAKNLLFACSIFLVVLLAACGSSGTTTGSTPTPAPTPHPSPSPAVTPTSAITLTTYTGNGYTIGYPQSWKVSTAANSVAFTDSSGIYRFSIVVSPNPGGVASPDTVVNAGIQSLNNTLKSPQTVNVPSSTTIGGDTWVQKSVAGTPSSGGPGGVVQLVVASDNHPANSPSTGSYTVIYGTLQATFDAANAQYFQPMLQSFKFTS